MKWMDDITGAIDYIENNITEELTIADIAKAALMSPYYFQKGFSMLCGFTVGEYIRSRRLSLAGSELLSTDAKIIDVALKYGYDSPDSFTKAFTRFHGITPTAAKKEGATLKSFARLIITISLKGGISMDYKIADKEAFTVIGVSRMFRYEDSLQKIPAFWTEHFQSGMGEQICGVYGMCIESKDGDNEFEYLIADPYTEGREVTKGLVLKTIPAHTWAIFPCKGALPKALQDVNGKIFSEWLPNSKDYEIAAGYNIEMYSDPRGLPMGTQDENYYSEIWIPVKKVK